jgi:molybdopterin converting factor small subunit
VRAWAQQRAARLQPLLAVSRLAVNCAYAAWEMPLHDKDEVALIPPVSGG